MIEGMNDNDRRLMYRAEQDVVTALEHDLACATFEASEWKTAYDRLAHQARAKKAIHERRDAGLALCAATGWFMALVLALVMLLR